MSRSKNPMPAVPFGNVYSNLPTYDDVTRGADRGMASSSRMQGYNNFSMQYPPPFTPPAYPPPAYPPQSYSPQPYPAQSYPAQSYPAQPLQPVLDIPILGGIVAQAENRHERKALRRLGKMERRELRRESKMERRVMRDGLWMGQAPRF